MRTQEELMSAIEQTFRVFAPEWAERWIYLLQHGRSRWKKISPLKIWPISNCDGCYPARTLEALVALPVMQRHMEANVIVFSSWSGEIYEAPLNKVLCMMTTDKDQQYLDCAILEGFIIIVPGELMFLTNHEGGCALLERSRQRSDVSRGKNP